MKPAILTPPSDSVKGFTLVELLIAVVISLSIGSAAGSLLISQLRTSERAESIAQQRDDWARTTNFIEAEVALSEKIYTHNKPFIGDLSVAIPSECSLASTEVRLQLDIRRDLPPVIYSVKASTSGWLGDYSLWRCGPSINEYGAFCTEDAINDSTSSCFGLPFVSNSLMLDGLSGNQDDGLGFIAYGNTNTGGSGDNKYIRFTVSLKGHSSRTYSRSDAARARISPLYSRPTDNSLCSASNMVKLKGRPDIADNNNTLQIPNQNQDNQDVLICGFGLGTSANGLDGDNISGENDTNDIIEAGDYGKATLDGLGGNDYLRGTLEADTLTGGDGDDTLVGREENDVLNGGSGQNTYLPGEGDDTVNGGSGLDIVFFSGERSNYTIDGACSTTSCTVSGYGASKSNGTNTLREVEIVIFRDARMDLED